jgi:hypothetical protein
VSGERATKGFTVQCEHLAVRCGVRNHQDEAISSSTEDPPWPIRLASSVLRSAWRCEFVVQSRRRPCRPMSCPDRSVARASPFPSVCTGRLSAPHRTRSICFGGDVA